MTRSSVGRRQAMGAAVAASLGVASQTLPMASAAASDHAGVTGGSDESVQGALSDPFSVDGTSFRSRIYLESGQFVVTGGQLDVTVLLVGGGGGGGWGCGGGGGEVVVEDRSLDPGTYQVVVGLGGEGGGEYFDGGTGGSSSFDAGGTFDLEATGGSGGFADEAENFQLYRGGSDGSGSYLGGVVAFGPEFRFRGGGGGGANGFAADGLDGGHGGNSRFVTGLDSEVLSLGGGGGGWDSQGEARSSAGIGAGDGGFGPLGGADSLGLPGGIGTGGGGGAGAGDFGVATGASGGSGRVVVRYRTI